MSTQLPPAEQASSSEHEPPICQITGKEVTPKQAQQNNADASDDVVAVNCTACTCGELMGCERRF